MQEISNPEDIYGKIAKNKPHCMLFFVETIPESHSFFQSSHVSQIQSFLAQQKRIERNVFWGTLGSFFFLERSLYARNMLYRLTFYRNFSMTLIKFFLIPSFLSSYIVFRKDIEFRPVLKDISKDYDLEEERFRKIFEEFMNKKSESFRRILEAKLNKEKKP